MNALYTPGIGDIESWSLPTGHANDPRTDEADELARIDAEADDMASDIIGTISVAVCGIDDPRDRLAAQVGRLQGMVRQLCSELAHARAES